MDLSGIRRRKNRQHALRVNPEEGFTLRWPIRKGNFNRRQYRSYRAVLDDLDKIWTRAITVDLKVPQKDLQKYGLVLVVPDVIKACEIRALTELALKQMGFKSVAFILESVAGTFGTGISGALVIDIGAQVTKVCCVEDGQISAVSQSILPYGGDQLTQLFLALLKLHSFPYSECDLNHWLDFELMDELTRRLLTMDEEDISSQIYEAYVRKPGLPTKIYPFKVFEERIVVPSALFEPGVPLLSKFITPDGDGDYYSGENDAMQVYYTTPDVEDLGASADVMPPSEAPSAADISMEMDLPIGDTVLSLEEAICKALDSLDAATNPERLKKALSSILVIGGSHKIAGLLSHLDTQLRSRYPGYEVEFVLGGATAPVKENAMDAAGVAWKGGAVYAKLECITDAWISRRDYEMGTVRAIRDRISFTPKQ
jgi:actin-related protein 8